jgi:hypothetical protein
MSKKGDTLSSLLVHRFGARIQQSGIALGLLGRRGRDIEGYLSEL